MTSHNVVRISSSNVRGLHDPQKRKDVFHYLRSKNMQIYCLQETHFTENLEPYIGQNGVVILYCIVYFKL